MKTVYHYNCCLFIWAFPEYLDYDECMELTARWELRHLFLMGMDGPKICQTDKLQLESAVDTTPYKQTNVNRLGVCMSTGGGGGYFIEKNKLTQKLLEKLSMLSASEKNKKVSATKMALLQEVFPKSHVQSLKYKKQHLLLQLNLMKFLISIQNPSNPPPHPSTQETLTVGP